MSPSAATSAKLILKAEKPLVPSTPLRQEFSSESMEQERVQAIVSMLWENQQVCIDDNLVSPIRQIEARSEQRALICLSTKTTQEIIPRCNFIIYPQLDHVLPYWNSSKLTTQNGGLGESFPGCVGALGFFYSTQFKTAVGSYLQGSVNFHKLKLLDELTPEQRVSPKISRAYGGFRHWLLESFISFLNENQIASLQIGFNKHPDLPITDLLGRAGYELRNGYYHLL